MEGDGRDENKMLEDAKIGKTGGQISHTPNYTVFSISPEGAIEKGAQSLFSGLLPLLVLVTDSRASLKERKRQRHRVRE